MQDSHIARITNRVLLDVFGYDDSDSIPRWPWFIFLAGAMGCLICSSVSHLFACHSKRFNFFFWRLDYAGISLMIVCSFFAPIYYAFACNPYSRLLYLSSISFAGILVITTLLAPSLSTPRFRSFRASLFLIMGFSGVIPAAHAVVLFRAHPQILVALGYELVMGVLYAVGAGFYMSRVPERWKPGAFDCGAEPPDFPCFCGGRSTCPQCCHPDCYGLAAGFARLWCKLNDGEAQVKKYPCFHFPAYLCYFCLMVSKKVVPKCPFRFSVR